MRPVQPPPTGIPRPMQSLPKSNRSGSDRDATGSSDKHADSLAKKRARDRRAQQNQRDKRNEQVRSLQEQLTRMESRMLHLSRECELLRRENNELRNRPGPAGQQFAASQSPTTPPYSIEALSNLNVGGGEETAGAQDPSRSNLEFWSQWAGSATSSPPVSFPIKSPTPRSMLSPWTNTPAHTTNDVVVTEAFKNWLRRPDLVHASPDQPQPIDLLYGSKNNFLADVINHSLRSWPCRDPERLAAGWLIYNLIKWMLGPSPENYARLQEFQIPVLEQLEHAHSYFIDFVFWPKLRASMIVHESLNSPEDVVGMFLCCVKLRWPWGQNFLEPKEDGTLRMRQDFFETFTSLDGWGITDDFFQKFPDLCQGLNMNAMRYRIC